jgi:hypothetical protein
MKIQWTIRKKRGNYRPTLHYVITLEDFEKELAVSSLTIKSNIPKIPNPHQPYCLPDTNERVLKWKPQDYHFISVPYFKNGELEECIRLPFRESGVYPEVEESLRRLHFEHEKIVRLTYAHEPLNERKELEMLRDTRGHIAANVFSPRLLYTATVRRS